MRCVVIAMALLSCAVCVEGGFAKASASRGASSQSKPKTASYPRTGVTQYIPPGSYNAKYIAPGSYADIYRCVPLATSVRENLGRDPDHWCRSYCFTLVLYDVNSSAACLEWNSQSVWDGDICTIAWNSVNGSSLSADREGCVVDGVSIPLYPGWDTAAQVNMSVVPWQCPLAHIDYSPPNKPSCETVGLSVGANMAMKNRCYSNCFTVVAMSIKTEADCTAWLNNSHWTDDRCRIACPELPMFNDSLPNGTCVVDGKALPFYPGVVNVSDNETFYAVPMPCAEERICKFSMVVDVSSDVLCSYSMPRFGIMIAWIVLGILACCFIQSDEIPHPRRAAFLCFFLLVGVVWEIGVAIIFLGLLVYLAVYACKSTKKKEYAPLVNPSQDPASCRLDFKNP